MKLLPGWVRSKRALRWTAVVAAFAVAVSLTLITVVPGPRPGPGVLAPGSQGSQSHLPWWDPRGWFSSGSPAPSSHVVPGTEAALPSRPRVLREVTAPPVRRVRELTAKRTEFSRTYQLSDGRRQAVISAAPVNYRDAAGRREPVNATVTASGRPGFTYQNVTNTFGSFFGTDPAQLMRFEAPGGGWLQVSLAGARKLTPRASGDVVTYREIAPGVTLSYQVTPTELKERIVLASPSAGGGLRFAVRAGGGLSPQALPGGGIGWSRDGTGAPVLVIPAPVMTDSRASMYSPYGVDWSPKVAQRIAWDAAAHTLRVTVTPDRGWLDAPGRVFPVVIDPTIEIAPTPTDAQNTFIEQDTPSSNYNSSWRLSVGTTSGGAVRSLLSFSLSTIPANTPIDSADLNLYFDQNFGPGTANQTVNAYQATSSWSASTATWSNASSNVGPEGLNEVYVDDNSTTSTTATGSWPSQANTSAVNGEYRYNQDTVAGDTFTWVPQLTESGSYFVSDHYVASSSAASNAPFTVSYSGGSHTFSVNQQSGTGGVWAVLGQEPFVAGTAGKVVLGDGPATSATRVEADQVRFRKWGSVTVDPNNANIWDSFSVRNIVQGWVNGTSPNYGFVLKAADESTLNVGGPRYEASRFAFQGETVNYPQLVVTYGRPAVSLNPITTINATGANLSWAPYTDPTPGSNTGDDLAEYQVHRSVYESFTPGAATLISPVAVGTTSYSDTSEPPTPATASMGNAFYYMVAVKTQDGQIIPGATALVRLPVAGHTIQIIHANGAATLSKALPATNEQNLGGQPWLATGDNSSTYGVTRAVISYPALASAGIPAGATVTEAHLKLWGWYNNNTGGGSATYEAHALNQSFTASQATWNNATSTTAWTTPGGSYNSTVADTVTGLTNDPNRENWEVTSIAQGWLTTPSSEHGLLLKLSGESSTSPQEQELFLNNAAAEQALAPELVVTYLSTTPDYTYFAPHTPHVAASSSSYTTDVTVTNTTATTMNTSDWVLTYHWLTPDGTDVTTSSDQAKTALPANLATGATTTVTATVDTPDTTGTGSAVTGYRLLWDLYNKTTGTWLSSGTATPNLTGTSTTAGTVGPLNQVTSVARSAGDLLGLEKYYQYTGVNTGSGTSLLNNDDTGNVVWNYNAFSNPSRGFATFVRMSYNSMDTSDSAMGFGWSLQASSLMRLGTPLDFHPYPNPTTVTLTDGDGTTHAFTWNSTTSTWTSPPGLHYYLQQVATCDPSEKTNNPRAWLLSAPDRTQFYFDCQGYQSAVVDRSGNEADFTYTWRNSSNKPVKFLDYITDPSGRQTLTLTYYQKGDSYSYIDSSGNVATGTNLTDPDIIHKIKTITDISGRQISLLYTTQGLMAQMTDGTGTSVAKTFKFGYDMTQGNKNVKLVSVTDPRGNTTHLAYYTAPVDPTFKWSLQTITNRLGGATNVAYTIPVTGQIQAQVTDPNSHTTTYLMDSAGRPIQVTNAKSQVTKLTWGSDNNVTSLTEDNGARTTWTWDPNTGYPLTMTDAQANHDGTAATTYTYQTGLSGHTADLISKLTPQQRLWTFGYDTFGNLTSVTDPDGNASGAAAGSYTTKYAYDSTGNLSSATDADGNPTNYSNYDPTGYPQTITDALGNATTYSYDSRGNVLSVADPFSDTTSYTYDVFGRLGQIQSPKQKVNGTEQYITTPPPVYDGNDNVTQSTDATGAVTNYSYNADDELTAKLAPPDSSGTTQPETTYTYDPVGNLKTVTEPDGNVTGATAGSYTTTYGYDEINELTSVTDAANNLTQYGYDDVGNKASVTDPKNNLTQYGHNLNHWPTTVTDAANFATTKGYDLDGLVTSTTDQNNNATTYTLDPRGDVIQQQVPHDTSGATTTYNTTQYVYDQVGNRTQVLTPQAVATGTSRTSTCITNQTCPFTYVTQYDADNRVSSQRSAYDSSNATYNTPAVTSYTYNQAGRLKQVTAPASGIPASGGPNITKYSYFDNNWVKNSTDPWNITTSYGYDNDGHQANRTITSADGAMSRAMTWTYYPGGQLSSMNDDGVPTGLYSEMVDNSDVNNTTSTGTWSTATSSSGYVGFNYQTGTGTSTFTWHLHVPADGNYKVYVAYPAVSGATTGANYTVTFSNGTGGTSTATVTKNQTQNTSTSGNTNWVQLGEWAFTQSGTGQKVTLAETSSGTMVADAVRVVRDNTGVSNTAHHAFTYAYDANANLTQINDNSANSPAITKYVMNYDQVDRITQQQDDNSAGTAVHTTTYGYDADSNLSSRGHDSAISTYGYNNRNLLASETDKSSSTDTSPQVTTFGYNPLGLRASEVKPNNNTLTYSYFADELLQQQTEDTSGGTLVDQHTYTYWPDGVKKTDAEKLMNADSTSAYLTPTLSYSYDPRDRLTQVQTDGTTTESYTHDANGNVVSQTINGTQTSFNYDRDRLLSATSGSTAVYNYDPIGRLDTITSGTTLLQSNTYDGFDNLTSQTQTTSSGTATTNYTYDPMNRQTSQTVNGTTTQFAYLGLSSQLISETGGTVPKSYAYTPFGERISQTSTSNGTTGYYTYNDHNDVEAITGATGTTTSTYGYTAYGQPIASRFTGADKNNVNPKPGTQPFNSYRFNAMRWDSGSGQYDMGFRNYDPGLNAFLSRDMYNGALGDLDLTGDPFTGNRYTFGAGNPISNIELDGHMLVAPGGGGGSTASSTCPIIELICSPNFPNAASSPGKTTTQTNGSAGNTSNKSLPVCNSVESRYTGNCTVVQPAAAKSGGTTTNNKPSLPGCNSVVSRLTGDCTVQMPSKTPSRAPDYYSGGEFGCFILCLGWGNTVDRYHRVYSTFQIGIGCCFFGAGGAPAHVFGYGPKPPSPSTLKSDIDKWSVNAGGTAGPATLGLQWLNPGQWNQRSFAIEPGGGFSIGGGLWIGASYTYPQDYVGTPVPPQPCSSAVESRYNGCYIQQTTG